MSNDFNFHWILLTESTSVGLHLIAQRFIYQNNSNSTMAAFNRFQVQLEKTGQSVTVPNAPEARLMYYLNCMCNVIDMDNTPSMRRKRNYSQYYLLDDSELRELLILCVLLSPDELLNRCIFQNDGLCGDSNNEFYNVNAVNTTLVVANSVVVGGQRRQVQKIMVFKRVWMERNYFQPLGELNERLRRQRTAWSGSSNTNQSGTCIIL